MTREEQCKNAASAYAKEKHPNWDKFQRAYSEIPYSEDALHDKAEDQFYDGARWADANRWLKVEDGLPDTNEKFHESDMLLCYDEEIDDIFVGWYNSITGNWTLGHFKATSEPVKVTHYTFLPSPPKAEQ